MTEESEGPGRVLLFLSTRSYRAELFLQAARELKVPLTIVADAPAPLAADPYGFLTVDFTRPQQAAQEVAAFARRQPVRAVLAAEDEGVEAAAAAAAVLGLPHHPPDAVAATRDKYLLRQRLAEAGLPSPWYRRYPLEADPERLAEEVPYPCVVKPLFLSASRGVLRADSPEAFVQAFRRVGWLLRQPAVREEGGTRAGYLLVEEYIPGVEVAVEGLVRKGDLQVLAIFDKPDPLEGPTFAETLYVTPSRHPLEEQRRITEAASEAARALGLSEGAAHLELRLNAKGAWVVDVAARSIGGLCARVLRFEGGLTLEGVLLRHALGLHLPALQLEGPAAGVMMIPVPRAGRLGSVEGGERAEAVPGVEKVEITVAAGEQVVPLPDDGRYLGFIFARGATPEMVEAALREAYRRLRFDIA